MTKHPRTTPALGLRGVLVAVLILVGSALAPLAGPSDAAASAGTTCLISTPASEFTTTVEASPGYAQVWRLYQATFLRQPKAGGIDYWARQRNAGADLAEIAYYFTSGPEFTNRYGQLSNRQFVQLVYSNVLCRTAAAKGENYWTGLLDTGSLDRAGMLVNFSELREYLRVTQTCHSIYPTETAAVAHCRSISPAPLTSATMSTHGYGPFNQALPRANGSSGSFRGVEVDLRQAISDDLFSTGPDRCSVASINANWLVASQKDAPDPGVLGLGVIEGQHARNSRDRTDRGVFGLRVDANPKSVVQVWPGDTLSPDDVRLNSVVYTDGPLLIESWHAAAEISPYLLNIEPDQIVGANDWIWAAAGIPLRVDGQTDNDFNHDYNSDPYTYQTLRHSFVAVDQDAGRLVFGATANADVRDLVAWATTGGYEDLIKFDGGGSTEFNVDGQAVIAGTNRDIPVWLGVGC